MKILIKSCRVVDSVSQHNGKKVDMLIEGGEITQIKQFIKVEDRFKIIEGSDLHVSIGWVDMQANFCDPGFEQKEDLSSGIQAAANGGYTGVCVMPSTNPPIHNKAQVEYILHKSRNSPVDLFPFGTISYRQEGKDLSEMYDMKLAGAVGFSDDKKPIVDAGLVLRALQYSDNIGSFIALHCNDLSLSNGGQMNEGEQSTLLGLKGIPSIAEELMLERNLSILEYAGGRMHISNVSTKRSVELIKSAKAKGLNVTAGVSVNNLLLDDSTLQGFDTRFKVDPPLRTRDDIEALKKGLLNGTIDVVVSDHRPEDVENKELEFDYAAFGATGLETAFSAFNTSCGKKIDVEKMVEIKEGEKANLSIFDPSLKWNVSRNDFKSKSVNSPFLDSQLTGRPIATVKGSHFHLVK
jgi:dihydroorotase